MTIICENDQDVELTTLKEFPFPPRHGDRVWIGGVEFEVLRLKFTTSKGMLDGIGGITVVLNSLAPAVINVVKVRADEV